MHVLVKLYSVGIKPHLQIELYIAKGNKVLPYVKGNATCFFYKLNNRYTSLCNHLSNHGEQVRY